MEIDHDVPCSQLRRDTAGRRVQLEIGFAGTLGFSLSLPDLLERQAAAETAPATTRRNNHAGRVADHHLSPRRHEHDRRLRSEARKALPEFAVISGRSTRTAWGLLKSRAPADAGPPEETNISLLRSFRITIPGMARPIITCLRAIARRPLQSEPETEQRASLARIDHRPRARPAGAVPPYVSVVDPRFGRLGFCRFGGRSFVAEGDPNTPGFAVPDLLRRRWPSTHSTA